MGDRLSPRAVAAAVVALLLLAVVVVFRRSARTGGTRLTGYATVD